MENHTCIVRNCPINSDRHFRSPDNPILLELWKKTLHLPADYKDEFFLCHEHFEDKYKIHEKLILTNDGCPTRFLNSIPFHTVCSSCLKFFHKNSSKMKCTVDRHFQDVFQKNLGCEIKINTTVCEDCFQQVMSFENFKKSIQKAHLINNKRSHSLLDSHNITIKEEPVVVNDGESSFVISEIKEVPEASTSFNFVIKNDLGEVTKSTKFKSTSGGKKKKIRAKKIKIDGEEFLKDFVECKFCSKSFESSALSEHVKQKHTFVCLKCNVILPFKYSLSHHQATNCGTVEVQGLPNMPFKFQCIVCKEKFFRKHQLDVHKKAMHGVYNKGLKKLKNKPPPSTKPTNSLNFPTKLSNEEKTATEQLQLINFLADPRGRWKRDSKNFLNNPIKEENLACLDCGNKFKSKDLFRHRIEVHGASACQSLNTYACDLCEMIKTSKIELLKHFRSRHKKKIQLS